MHVRVERVHEHEVELADEREVSLDLLEHRVDQHGLTRLFVREQVCVRRGVRVEELP